MTSVISFPQAGLREAEPCSGRIGNHGHEQQMIPAKTQLILS